MARRYGNIWKQLKETKRCIITCRLEKMDTIIRCMYKEKARENAIKTALEIPSYGRLKVKKIINKAAGTAIIDFRLVVGNKAFDL
jgi:hypothetical protein